VHGCALQTLVSEQTPGHGSPPFNGGGWLHKRLLLWTPPPQEILHSLQGCHGDQPPCTGHEIRKQILLKKKSLVELHEHCMNLEKLHRYVSCQILLLVFTTCHVASLKNYLLSNTLRFRFHRKAGEAIKVPLPCGHFSNTFFSSFAAFRVAW